MPTNKGTYDPRKTRKSLAQSLLRTVAEMQAEIKQVRSDELGLAYLPIVTDIDRLAYEVSQLENTLRYMLAQNS